MFVNSQGTIQKDPRFFARLIGISGALVFVKARDGRYELVNQKWEDVTGLSHEQILGRTDMEIFPGEIGRQFRENDLRIMEAGQVEEVEEVLDAPDGQRYFISIKFPLLDDQGIVNGLCGMTTEITDRKRAEDALRKAEQNYRELVEQIPAVVYQADPGPNGKWHYVSPQLLDMFGFEPDEWMHDPQVWEQQIHPEDRENILACEQAALANRQALTMEYRVYRRNGELAWIRDESNLITLPSGKVVLQGFLTDITEYKKAEQIIRRQVLELTILQRVSHRVAKARSEEEIIIDVQTIIKEAMEFSEFGIMLLDETRGVLRIPEIYQSLYPLIPDLPLGKGIVGQVALSGISCRIGDVRDVPGYIAHSPSTRSELCVPIKAGERTLGIINLESDQVDAFSDEDERLMETISGQVASALERLHAEDAVRRADETLRLVVEQTGQIIYELDVASGKISWYGAYGSLLGYTDEEFQAVTVENWGDLIHADDREHALGMLNAAFENVDRYMVIYRFQRKDGGYIFMEDIGMVLPGKDGKAGRMVGAMKDITERKRFEAEIQRQSVRAQILADISQTLAGMTQDANKIMDTIVERTASLIGDGASLLTYVAGNPFLELAASYNPDPELDLFFRDQIRRHPIGVNEGAYGHVLQSEQAILIPSVDMDAVRAAASPERQEYYAKLPVYSAMFVALHAEGQILGILGLGRHDPTKPHYTADDLNFLQDIADRTSMALLNAQRHKALQKELADRIRAEDEVRILNASLEQRVRERTAELESANKELETFSYSVSHDLRAPLRNINGFARMIIEDYEGQLSTDMIDRLDRIQKIAGQMGQLIDDILAFSRLSRHVLRRKQINMTALAQDAMNSLLVNLPAGKKVDFQLAQLPDAVGDQTLLGQVFLNLLDNALKYSQKRETIIVRVGVEHRDDESIYFVQDNGAGFDMRYADKLFGVFHRLHRSDEFEGTGIGLANVKRIIDRHGGRIWANAELERGATFYFTLP